MSPELQKQLLDMLAKMTDAAGSAGQQIPSLVSEKILYGRIEEPVGLLIMASLFIFCVRVVKRGIREMEQDDSSGWVFGVVGGVVGGCLGFVGACLQLDSSVMAWLAPRLYIVEWLKGMVTKS